MDKSNPQFGKNAVQAVQQVVQRRYSGNSDRDHDLQIELGREEDAIARHAEIVGVLERISSKLDAIGRALGGEANRG